MVLSCELSPVAYAELYADIRRDREMLKRLDDRLSTLNRDAGWLEEAEDVYRAYWDWQVGQANGDITTLDPVGVRHAQLATWLIAPLRMLGPSVDFSRDLAVAVGDAVRTAFPDTGRLPDQFRVSVVAWTLGRVCGDVDRSYPVVPAELPTDVDVAAAYRGLLEHVSALQDGRDPWPEMIGSAILWRVAGIAEGLRPQQEKANLLTSLHTLMKEVSPVLPDGLHAQLSREWDGFRDLRNSFTHVAPAHGGAGLAAVEDRARCADEVRSYLTGATYFICNEVAVNLAETDESMGRERMLDALDDISWAL